MDPVTGAALIGGGVALTQAIGTTAFNASQATKQMRFQREMANTAHQREVRDLRAAGLNPILSSKLGGAAVPPGASAQAQSPDIAGTYTNAKRQQAEMLVMAAQANQANSAAGLNQAQTSDINVKQMPTVDLLIAQKELQLAQSRKTGGADTNKIVQEIINLKSAKEKIGLDIAHSALDLGKKRIERLPYTIGGKVLDKAVEVGGKVKEEFSKSKAKPWEYKRTPKRPWEGRW